MALTGEHQHPDIKIFVSAHKTAVFPEGNSILPVQVGAAKAAKRFDNTLHDDEGENISCKNPRYCELTAQYWAWKNEDADYYGFCHYRRYFDFTDTPHQENDYGEIIDSYIDSQTIKEYGINDGDISKVVDDGTLSPRRLMTPVVLVGLRISSSIGMRIGIFASRICVTCTTFCARVILITKRMLMRC